MKLEQILCEMPYKDKNKQRDYQRQWVKDRRAEFLNGKVCVQCGCGDSDKLEVDHINPDMKISHKIWSWSAERRAAELAKCQILCKDCHRIKTDKDVADYWTRKHPRPLEGEFSDSPDDSDVVNSPEPEGDIPF